MPKDRHVKKGLYKRGDTWCIDVFINGRRYRKAAGPDKKVAELMLAELKKQRALGRASNDWSGLEQFTKKKRIKTFEEAANDYMSERQSLKPATLRGYNEILKNYLLPEFGVLRVDQISEEQIAKFQARVAQKVSAVRTNNIMGLLRYVLKVCVRRKLISENPASGIAQLTEEPAKIFPLTLDELERVLKTMHPHYRPLFTTLAFTGARPNELLALRWEDVDFEAKEIHIKRGRVRGHEHSPKTMSSQRVVPMFPIVRDALWQLKQARTQNLEGYVFLSKKGQPIDKHMDRQWRVALKKAGVRHRPSYQLRHTFASMVLKQGCDPAWLSRVLGHTTMQTTFKHYARYIEDASKENERRLEQTLTSKLLSREERTKER